jgi:hypothetical protein
MNGFGTTPDGRTDPVPARSHTWDVRRPYISWKRFSLCGNRFVVLQCDLVGTCCPAVVLVCPRWRAICFVLTAGDCRADDNRGGCASGWRHVVCVRGSRDGDGGGNGFGDLWFKPERGAHSGVGPTVGVTAAADEVPVGIAHLFSRRAQGYQAVAGQAAAFHSGSSKTRVPARMPAPRPPMSCVAVIECQYSNRMPALTSVHRAVCSTNY